ncbi:MAG: (2Fe-2S)-binding protein [Pseudomonadota bacterium]
MAEAATFDLAVLGAGPAGASAAAEARRLGLSVLVLDQEGAAGGQVWRAAAASMRETKASAEARAGNDLRAALARSGAEARFGRRVWSIQRDAEIWRLRTHGDAGAEVFGARALALAAGAQERVLPVPGWTLPGVIGLAAATALIKGQGVLPGRRVVFAGCGPLLPLAAHLAREGGAQVVAVVDLNGPADYARRLPAILSRPDLALRGASWLAGLAASGAAILTRHAVRRVEGDGRVERVIVGPVGADHGPDGAAAAERRFEADALCLGHGLIPATEASRMLGAAHVFDAAQGGWRPETDPCGRTSVPLLYAAGDGAGVQGAAAAPLRGVAAARAAAEDLGRAGAAQAPAGLARAARFGRAMTELSQPGPGLLAHADPGTILCRCESLTRAEAEAELRDGAASPAALKSGTRLGMGPCGGRFCAEAAARLACEVLGTTREALGPPSARPPILPVPISALAEGFDYDELPMPQPAPL